MPPKAQPQTPLTPAAFQAASGVSDQALARLTSHVALLRRWQRKINLVAAASLEDVWRRHVLDSAQFAEHLPRLSRSPPGSIVDLGSGAGFPGLVLAAMGSGDLGPVTLIESNARKCAFLAEAAREMGLSGSKVAILNRRIEDLGPMKTGAVTSRALAPLARLLELAEPFIGEGGPAESGGRPLCLFAKGRTWQEELTEAGKRWNITATPIPSLTDPAGAILKVEHFERRNA